MARHGSIQDSLRSVDDLSDPNTTNFTKETLLDDSDNDDIADSPSATENTAPFRFMDLIPEMRNMINHFILVSPEPVLIEYCQHSKFGRHQIQPYTIVQTPMRKKTLYEHPFMESAVNHLLVNCGVENYASDPDMRLRGMHILEEALVVGGVWSGRLRAGQWKSSAEGSGVMQELNGRITAH